MSCDITPVTPIYIPLPNNTALGCKVLYSPDARRLVVRVDKPRAKPPGLFAWSYRRVAQSYDRGLGVGSWRNTLQHRGSTWGAFSSKLHIICMSHNSYRYRNRKLMQSVCTSILPSKGLHGKGQRFPIARISIIGFGMRSTGFTYQLITYIYRVTVELYLIQDVLAYKLSYHVRYRRQRCDCLPLPSVFSLPFPYKLTRPTLVMHIKNSKDTICNTY